MSHAASLTGHGRRRHPARRLLALAALLCGLCLGCHETRQDGGSHDCTDTQRGWCLARRIAGSDPQGELGFRFGEPLDVDGDGHADIAAGARFKLQQKTLQNGNAAVWSGADGTLIRAWDGELPDGLFGHWVLPVPDLSGDGLADLIISAPNARVDGIYRGVVFARSPKTGAQIWQRPGTRAENFGWDMVAAGDRNGDGMTDLFVGAPSQDGGQVYLVSGKDGAILRTYAPESPVETFGVETFGWYVAALGDLDGDGQGDLAVGAQLDRDDSGVSVGGAYVLSAATGRQLFAWKGTDDLGGFGEVVAGLGDLDGDGKGEIVVAAPRTNDVSRTLPGEVRIYSGATGAELRRMSGSQPGELFGRMVANVGDVDGDGMDDLAIGAPWYRRGNDAKVGRFELRSGRTGAVLAELFGDGLDCWFGWHIRRAPDPEGLGRPALLVASLRHPVGGQLGVGVLDLLVRK